MTSIPDEVLIFQADARTASTSYVSVPRRGLVRWMLKEVEESIAIQLQQPGAAVSSSNGLSTGHNRYLKKAHRELRGVPALQHRDVHILERAAAAADWSAGALSPSHHGSSAFSSSSSSAGGSGGKSGGRGRLNLDSTANEKDRREAGIRPHITARRGCVIVSLGPVAAAILSSKLLMFVGSGSDDDLRPILAKVAEVFAPAAAMADAAFSCASPSASPQASQSSASSQTAAAAGAGLGFETGGERSSSSSSSAPMTSFNHSSAAAGSPFSFLPLHPAIVSGTFLNPSSPSYFPLLSWELWCLEMLLTATTSHYSRLVEKAEETTVEVTLEATRDEEASMIKWGAFAGLAYRCLRGSARGAKRLLCCQCRELCASFSSCFSCCCSCCCCRGVERGREGGAATSSSHGNSRRSLSSSGSGASSDITIRKKPANANSSPRHFTGGLRWFALWLTKDSMDAASNIIRLGQVGSSLKGLRSAVGEVQRALSHVLDQQDDDDGGGGNEGTLGLHQAGDDDHGDGDGRRGNGSAAPFAAPSGPEGYDGSLPAPPSSSSSVNGNGNGNGNGHDDSDDEHDRREWEKDEKDAATSALSAFVFPLSRRAVLLSRRLARKEKRKKKELAAITNAAAGVGGALAPEEGEEEESSSTSSLVEVLLESYLAASDSLLRRARMLIEEVDSSESHSRLLMAVAQNHIWSAQVVLSSVSGLLACALVVAAFFGMNLGNADADFTEPYGNWLAVVLTMSAVVIVGSICAAAAIFRYLDAGGHGK